MNIIEQFTGREAGAMVQFIKYALGGGMATLTHIVLFHLAAWKLFPCLQKNDWAVELFNLSVEEEDDSTRSRNSMIDNIMAFIFSNMVAYLINIYWVFEPGRHTFFVEIGLFYLVSCVSLVIGTSLMGYIIKRYGVRTTYAFATNIFMALMINYMMRKFIIFKG
ncbi:MAG: GtrA family protein [Candidatus Tritonobacter lacicola]|nr:GtrA family protein [Candidatus Tritonobacter lacicola]